MRIQLAGGVDETIMSEVSAVILPYFTMAEATALRLVCRELLEAVRDYQWEDGETVIQGSIGAWRGSFPRARCASVRKGDWLPGYRSAPVVDGDFVHFVGLRELNMSHCNAVTDAAFAHLRGILTLNMSFCYQSTITDAAFAHLVGIQRLGMLCCCQFTITDSAFVHLRGIQVLDMSYCRQLTDGAFVHLRGIHTLCMHDCIQHALTDAAFVHLRGVATLVIEYCAQATITGATFAHLQGIQAVGMLGCRADQVAIARSLGLRVNTRACIRARDLHYTFDESGWDDEAAA